MSHDRQALSEALEIIGRGVGSGEIALSRISDPRLMGALLFVADAATWLDRMAGIGWPGTGTVADRRADAHLKNLETDTEERLANFTAAARSLRK